MHLPILQFGSHIDFQYIPFTQTITNVTVPCQRQDLSRIGYTNKYHNHMDINHGRLSHNCHPFQDQVGKTM